jgi:hypothetical protein
MSSPKDGWICFKGIPAILWPFPPLHFNRRLPVFEAALRRHKAANE